MEPNFPPASPQNSENHSNQPIPPAPSVNEQQTSQPHSIPNPSPQPTGAIPPQPIIASPATSPQQPIMPWDKPVQPTAQPTLGGLQQNGTSQNNSSQPALAMQYPPSRNSKKILTIIFGALAGLFLLGGGAAAAYFGVIVPNKPENVLRQALINTAQEKEMSVSGTFDMKAADVNKADATPATKITYAGKSNLTKKQGEVTLKITTSGIDFPIDARIIDNTMYVKVGDLKTIMSLISGYAGAALSFDSAELDPLITNVSNLVSDQWIEFDSTLLDTAGASCVTDANLTLTDQDIQLLEDLYVKNPFATINSHGSDTINGKAATKFEISVDDNKGAKFLDDKKLEELSFMKALKKCPKEVWDGDVDTKDLADGDITPLTLWVDKDTKRITKVAGHSTKQDAEKSNLEAKFDAVITYGKVSVSRPENTKPAMQIWGELTQEFSTFFNNTSQDIPLTTGATDGFDYPYNSVPQ